MVTSVEARLFVPMLFNSDEEVEHSETSAF